MARFITRKEATRKVLQLGPVDGITRSMATTKVVPEDALGFWQGATRLTTKIESLEITPRAEIRTSTNRGRDLIFEAVLAPPTRRRGEETRMGTIVATTARTTDGVPHERKPAATLGLGARITRIEGGRSRRGATTIMRTLLPMLPLTLELPLLELLLARTTLTRLLCTRATARVTFTTVYATLARISRKTDTVLTRISTTL